MKREIHILLVDNGSYKPEAVLNLRNVAKKLSLKSSKVINPVSLLHSNKISDSKLNNIPADVFEPYVSEKVKNGTNEFLILPLFFGRSAAIYEYLPQRMEGIQQECGQFDLKIAPPLVDLDDANNDDVAQILADLVREEISYNKLDFPSVTLVDHGTPRIKVNEVRNFIAEQLALILKDEVQCVKPSSMESREGEEYSFNKPLLEDILGSSEFERDVILSMLFISPGRHAGKGGDIDKICAESRKKHSALKTFMTGLFSEHEGSIDVLNKRLNQGLETEFI